MEIFCKSREQLIRERITVLERLMSFEIAFLHQLMPFEMVNLKTYRWRATRRAIDRMWKMIHKNK